MIEACLDLAQLGIDLGVVGVGAAQMLPSECQASVFALTSLSESIHSSKFMVISGIECLTLYPTIR